MKCGYCGKNIKDNAKFCTYCGHNLREIEPEGQTAQKSKGGYISSLLTLLAIAAILCSGGICLLNGGGKPNDVSPSDIHVADITPLDEALFGKWGCTDRTAADYSPSDYGIDVNIILQMKNDGKFTLDYSMTDTGVPALDIKLDGKYSAKNHRVTFKPDLSKLSGDTEGNYFKNHGNEPAFEYSVSDSVLIFKYENGTDVKFQRLESDAANYSNPSK